MKLYNLYSVISNKTIRNNEKFYKKYPKHKFIPGVLVQTNRGYFIDGHNVDLKSMHKYLDLVSSAKKGIITTSLYPVEKCLTSETK